MNNPYLAKLRALNLEKGIPGVPTKLTKPLIEGNREGSVGFVSDQGSHFPEPEKEEPTAIVEHEAEAPPVGISGVYAEALGRLHARCPEGVDELRWHEAVHDAGLFIEAWGALAERWGWTASDLFDLHPKTPLARYDVMGLVWLLHGRPVAALTETSAAIRTTGGGAVVFRRNRLGSAA